jgi:hypothetical protein
MEVTGLLFGAIGVIVPAYQAMQALTQRINDTKNFPRKLRQINVQLTTQKTLFDSECKLLFPPGLDDAQIHQMLANERHPMWKDREFQYNFKQYHGDSFNQSLLERFEIIQETFEELEIEISKVTIEKGSKAVSTSTAGVMYVILRCG